MTKELKATLRKVSENELEPLDKDFLSSVGMNEGDKIKLQFQNASTIGTVTPNQTIEVKKDFSDFFHGLEQQDNISVDILKIKDKPKNLLMEFRQYLGEI